MRPEQRLGRVVADRYRLDRIIGRGGMGVVYAGTHTWTERPVAVKVLKPEYAEEGEVLRRFFQEAKAAAGLRHPNVVDVLDMGEDEDGSAFLVLELLEGEPLGALLEREKVLDPTRALRILLPVMDALSAAHASGIIHRDLKPDNIFISTDPRGAKISKLLDFGVAKLAEGGGMNTKTGTVIGTPHYMAPEQIRALKDLTGAADVWSMGVLLYRALSGTLPFDAESGTLVLMQIVTQDARPLKGQAPDVPDPLADAVHGALKRDRAQRYQTMTELLDALLAAAKSSGIEARDPRP